MNSGELEFDLHSMVDVDILAMRRDKPAFAVAQIHGHPNQLALCSGPPRMMGHSYIEWNSSMKFNVSLENEMTMRIYITGGVTGDVIIPFGELFEGAITAGYRRNYSVLSPSRVVIGQIIFSYKLTTAKGKLWKEVKNTGKVALRIVGSMGGHALVGAVAAILGS